MKNVLIVAVLVIITALIVKYLINEKKKGAVCIGCPYSGKCSGHSACSLDGFEFKTPVK